MNPALLAALISQVGVPELKRWLSNRGTDPITDAEILEKLKVDATKGIELGRAWLRLHPKDVEPEG